MGRRLAHRSLIYWLSNIQADAFIDSYVHPVRRSMTGPFIDWSVDSLMNHGFGAILLYYTILYYNALYYIVLRYTLTYYNIIYYIIFRCIVLRCIVLYGPMLTASYFGPFVGGFNGRLSKWAVDWGILSFY